MLYKLYNVVSIVFNQFVTITIMITNNLSTLMGSKRVRIAEIARITGLTNDTISKIYNDKTKGIDFKTLDKLCWALECTPNDIFPYTPDA